MKILISAFSCGPDRGSEPGVGWNVALEVARLGHDVVVVTQSECRAEILEAVAHGKVPKNLTFDIYTPRWLEIYRDTLLRLGFFTVTWQSTNILWQLCLLRHIRKNYDVNEFGLIHHVTMAGIRQPSLLTLLGRPSVIGPIGGGETAPVALRKAFPLKSVAFELLRDLSTFSLRFDPMTRASLKRASLIFLRSPESLVAVPASARNKVLFDVGIALPSGIQGVVSHREQGHPLKLLYAGRFVYWKGPHLAIAAVAMCRSQGIDVTLDMVGDGPGREPLKQLAKRLGVDGQISWMGEVSQGELFRIYRERHAFIFPSLHDSAGTVILEAFAFGLPVICLGIGGPGQLVDDSCGRVVSGKLDEAACVSALSESIAQLAHNEELRMALGATAIQRYREATWPNVVRRLYAAIESRLFAPSEALESNQRALCAASSTNSGV